MASGNSNESRPAINRSKPRSERPGSEKLGQTLQDLESAFADWEALSDTAGLNETSDQSQHTEASSRDVCSNQNATVRDTELRRKTKLLLDQLRQQLIDLAD